MSKIMTIAASQKDGMKSQYKAYARPTLPMRKN